MKNKILLTALLVALFVGCKKEEPVIQPSAKFSYKTDELSVSFMNQSTNAVSYYWDFGNGGTSTQKDPIIYYKSEGTYSVSLIARNRGVEDTYTQNVTVSYHPKASFTYKTEHPLKVVFTNKSTNADSYRWDFGDGKTSTEKNPTHRYNTLGVYKVSLTVKHGSQQDTYQSVIEVKAPSTCMISGFTITKIPTNNKYYQVQITDDYIISKTTYVWTNWFLLSSANLPYTYTFNSPKTININNTYVIRLYKYAGTGNPSDTQASGKGDWSASFSYSKLSTYPETLSYSNSTAAITINFSWK